MPRKKITIHSERRAPVSDEYICALHFHDNTFCRRKAAIIFYCGKIFFKEFLNGCAQIVTNCFLIDYILHKIIDWVHLSNLTSTSDF